MSSSLFQARKKKFQVPSAQNQSNHNMDRIFLQAPNGKLAIKVSETEVRWCHPAAERQVPDATGRDVCVDAPSPMPTEEMIPTKTFLISRECFFSFVSWPSNVICLARGDGVELDDGHPFLEAAQNVKSTIWSGMKPTAPKTGSAPCLSLCLNPSSA